MTNEPRGSAFRSGLALVAHHGPRSADLSRKRLEMEEIPAGYFRPGTLNDRYYLWRWNFHSGNVCFRNDRVSRVVRKIRPGLGKFRGAQTGKYGVIDAILLTIFADLCPFTPSYGQSNLETAPSSSTLGKFESERDSTPRNPRQSWTARATQEN